MISGFRRKEVPLPFSVAHAPLLRRASIRAASTFGRRVFLCSATLTTNVRYKDEIRANFAVLLGRLRPNGRSGKTKSRTRSRQENSSRLARPRALRRRQRQTRAARRRRKAGGLHGRFH